MRLAWTSISIIGFTLLAGTVRASGTRIITQPGGPTFPDIQSAVNASHDGDIVLVASGSYAGFTIDGKGVWVVALPSASVTVYGQVQVLNIAATESVVLSGLGSTGSRFLLRNSAGDIRLQSCEFVSIDGAPIVDFPCYQTPPTELPASTIDACERVSLYQCDLRGANGDSCGMSVCRGGEGQTALAVQQSDVALYECSLVGGKGGTTINCAHVARGGDACRVVGRVFASGCTFQGGAGGDGGNPATSAGPGANGIVVAPASTVRLVECELMGGAGGLNICFGGVLCPGPPGYPFDGIATTLQYARTVCSRSSFFSSGTAFDVHAVGAPGASVWLSVAPLPAHHYSDPAKSVRLLPTPLFVGVPPWILPPQGTAQFALGLNYPTTGIAVQRLHAQCYFLNTHDATWHFGNPLELVCIDASAAPDCNANGVCDYVDLLVDPGLDSNSNLVPDTCPGG
jgi:hypothetical protein